MFLETELPSQRDYTPKRGSIIERYMKHHNTHAADGSFFAQYCDLCHIRLTEEQASLHLRESKHQSSSIYFVPNKYAPDFHIDKVRYHPTYCFFKFSKYLECLL